MGWASKLEDEMERRAGAEPPLATARKVLASLADFNMTFEIAPRKVTRSNGLDFEKVDSIVAKIRTDFEKLQAAHASLPINTVKVDGLGSKSKFRANLKALKKIRVLAKELQASLHMWIQAVAPSIRVMPSGEERRRLQLQIARLKRQLELL